MAGHVYNDRAGDLSALDVAARIASELRWPHSMRPGTRDTRWVGSVAPEETLRRPSVLARLAYPTTVYPFWQLGST